MNAAKSDALNLPLRGIVPPIVTPLIDRDTLDRAGLERLLEHILGGGVHGLFILGTTGEGPSLSYRLRRELIDQVCRQVAGRVPVLLDGEQRIWDSLSIAEYVAETFPEKQLWPADRSARALARSLCAEMHAGFPNLRQRMPMNCEAHLPGARTEVAVQRDIDRILEIWGDCRKAHAAGGPFLFGNFSIADAYFAPVVSRFATYGVALDATAQAYADHIAGLPAMQEWVRAALDEREFVAHDEPYRRQR